MENREKGIQDAARRGRRNNTRKNSFPSLDVVVCGMQPVQYSIHYLCNINIMSYMFIIVYMKRQ